ncbi:MarR family winged helix-turn-helix transcriptional regulator [Neotamlana laminarinivorans]|uniref:HTH-type transcriptional regulator SarZ n=1 Tax=Neotamlana laminarinivorans TaxID=2883124 RepID=A0A9X1L0T7_9FLAO|nr:MarR family transcriptional regulator [Tamlana laminarinivorans]MCB4797940.1 MarR family transcriptional regulator [Tamlana laminarinivorans]
MKSDKLKLNQQLCFPIYLLAKDIVSLYKPLLQAINLTYPQYLVMLILWEHNALSLKSIGEKLSLDSGTLTPLIKRLLSKELVIKKRSEKDERIVNISLTEKGKALKTEAQCIPEELMSIMNLTNEELENFRETIKKILNKRK